MQHTLQHTAMHCNTLHHKRRIDGQGKPHTITHTATHTATHIATHTAWHTATHAATHLPVTHSTTHTATHTTTHTIAHQCCLHTIICLSSAAGWGEPISTRFSTYFEVIKRVSPDFPLFFWSFAGPAQVNCWQENKRVSVCVLLCFIQLILGNRYQHLLVMKKENPFFFITSKASPSRRLRRRGFVHGYDKNNKHPQPAYWPMTIVRKYFHTIFKNSRRDGLKLLGLPVT